MATADVARRAGVAKGTVFLYFPTKEALGLALLEDLLQEWFTALDAELARATAARGPRVLARILAETLSARPVLGRMLAIAGSVLERNVDAGTLVAFEKTVLERMRRTGGALEAGYPFLSRGDGLRLLLYVRVLVVGLHPVAEPAPAAREARAAPELAPLRLDYAGSLESALRVHLEGLRALRARPE